MHPHEYETQLSPASPFNNMAPVDLHCWWDSLDGAELDHCYPSFAEQKEKGGKMCCSAIRERMKKSL